MLREKRIKKGFFRGLVSLILVFVMLVSVFLLLNRPFNSDALSAGEITNATFVGYLDGVEKVIYRANTNGSILFYNANGSTFVKSITGSATYNREYLRLTNLSTGSYAIGYCVEFGADVVRGNSYSGAGYLQDVAYFRNLPDDVKQLILAAVYYGRNGSNKVPVSGADDEDFYYATQVMIWEIQQQIRIFDRDEAGNVIGTKTVDAHGMSKTYFHKLIDGRAAEKCYDYLAAQMANHFIVPEFIGETGAKAKAVTLKYDMLSQSWHTELTDSKNTDFNFTCSDDTVKYSREGNRYRFSSKDAIDGEKVIKIKRKTTSGSSADNLLIWSSTQDGNQQVMATGSAAPAEFYMKLKTDVPAQVIVEKQDEETEKAVLLAGTEYKVKSVELDMYVSEDMKNAEGDSYFTDRNGNVTIGEKLQAGSYLLEEAKAPEGYVVAKEAMEFQVNGKSEEIGVQQENMPQKGIITIKKIGEYKHNDKWDDIREKVMGGIDFDIVALEDIVTADGTLRAEKGQVVDTVRTDFKGNVSTKELYLGVYNVVEKGAPMEYRISEPINVALVYGEQDVDVVQRKVNILNRLKRPGDSFGTTPGTGDDKHINDALLTLLISLSLIATMSVAFALRKED